MRHVCCAMLTRSAPGSAAGLPKLRGCAGAALRSAYKRTGHARTQPCERTGHTCARSCKAGNHMHALCFFPCSWNSSQALVPKTVPTIASCASLPTFQTRHSLKAEAGGGGGQQPSKTVLWDVPHKLGEPALPLPGSMPGGRGGSPRHHMHIPCKHTSL